MFKHVCVCVRVCFCMCVSELPYNKSIYFGISKMFSFLNLIDGNSMGTYQEQSLPNAIHMIFDYPNS